MKSAMVNMSDKFMRYVTKILRLKLLYTFIPSPGQQWSCRGVPGLLERVRPQDLV